MPFAINQGLPRPVGGGGWPVIRALICAALGIAATVLRGDGENRWPGPYIMESSSFNPRIRSSAAVDDDGTIYVGVTFRRTPVTGRVVALTPVGDTDVREKWPGFDTGGAVDASPTISPDGTLYIGSDDGIFHAIDKNTGREKWSYDVNQLTADPAYIYSTAALSRDGQTVYVCYGGWGAYFDLETDGGICAFSKDGKLLWSRPAADSVEASPAVGDDGTVYFGCFDGTFYAYRPDGTERWHRKLNGEIWASAAIGNDGTIYVGSLANDFVALTPDNKVKWRRELVVPGSPVLGVDGTVYVGNLSDGNLYALRGSDGSTLWQVPAQVAAGATPTVRADGTVLFAGENNSLTAYEPTHGNVLWSRSLRGAVMSAPAISPTSDHGIFVGAASGLYAFRGNEYGLSRFSSWPTLQRDSLHRGLAAERLVNGWLTNLSARGPAGPSHNLIAGLALRGTESTQALVRAVGPALAGFGVAAPLPDPVLTGHVSQGGALVPYANDNWGDDPDAEEIASVSPRVGAFPLPAGSKDAAVLARVLPTLTYSTTVGSKDGASGVAMVEVYDARGTATTTRLVNLSTRGHVGNGEGVLIAGIAVGGTGPVRVLVRAVGPGLQQFGVPGVLARPSISAYDKDGKLVGSNTVWTTGPIGVELAEAFTLVGAFPLADNSADSAMLLTLSPGTYTFHVSGVADTTGEALVEAYALPF